MIKTPTQYALALKWIDKFTQAAADLEAKLLTSTLDPELRQAQIASLRSEAKHLREQVDSYKKREGLELEVIKE